MARPKKPLFPIYADYGNSDKTSQAWKDLSDAQRGRIYELLYRRVNKTLSDIEKKSIPEFHPIYVSIKERGDREIREGKEKPIYRLNTGNVGVRKMVSKKQYSNYSLITKETKRLYDIAMASSFSSTVDADRVTKQIGLIRPEVAQDMAKKLAKGGVDFYEMIENPKAYSKELTDFWTLYNEAKDSGIFDDFGLKSEDLDSAPVEIMREVWKMGTSKAKGAAIVANVAKQKYKEVLEQRLPGETPDETRQRIFIDDFYKKKTHSMADILLNKIAEKKWGKAIVGSDADELNSNVPSLAQMALEQRDEEEW